MGQQGKMETNWFGFREKIEAEWERQRMNEICEAVRRDRHAAEEQAVSCSHWGMH